MDRFLRTASLLGEAALKKLSSSRVAVFGIGGVGSYALEALVRSGIGQLDIFDNDTVSVTNINRQLIALESTVGELKTTVAAARCRDINPYAIITEHPIFVNKESIINFEAFDFIIDAVDCVEAKVFLAQNAEQKGVPIISVMGTGNKLCPESLRISDIYETRECPLCRAMRTSLKKAGVKSLKVVWSDERPLKPQLPTDNRENGRPTPSSMSFVPASAGILAASFAVRTLIEGAN